MKGISLWETDGDNSVSVIMRPEASSTGLRDRMSYLVERLVLPPEVYLSFNLLATAMALSRLCNEMYIWRGSSKRTIGCLMNQHQRKSAEIDLGTVESPRGEGLMAGTSCQKLPSRRRLLIPAQGRPILAGYAAFHSLLSFR